MQIFNMPSGPLAVNTYLVIDENTKKGFIVDPGGYDDKLADKIKNENTDIEYIILTHGHADHIGGVNEYVREFSNIKVVADKDEEAMLADPNFNMSTSFGKPCSVKADITVKDGDELKAGDLTLKFLHTPGHSPGGMCIYLPYENVVFSGDTLFCQSIGRTDFPGCSFDQLADSIRTRLFVLPDETDVYPGHMGPTNIGFEKGHNPFVRM